MMNTEKGKLGEQPNTIPLGYWPTIYANFHRHFRQSSLLIQAVSGTGPINEEALDRALQATCVRHPLLNCRLVEADALNALQETSDNRIQLQIRHVDQLNTMAIASSLLSEGIGDDMWRVSLTKSLNAPDHWVLTMLCHHAIGDARSMVSLFDQVLACYADSSLQNNTLYDLQNLPETLGGIEIPYSKVAANLAEWPIEKFELLGNRQVGLLEVPLAIPDLNRYLEVCKRERVSLTNLITVSLLRAQGFKERARVATTVDIRGRVNPVIGAEHFGCFAGVIESAVPWANDIWDHARLSAAFQFRGKNRLLMPIPDGAILTRMMRARIDNALGAQFFAGGCAVSDVGDLTMQSRYGALAVNSIVLANRQLAGLYGVFLTASRFEGILSLNMSFAHPLLTFPSAQLLGQRISDQMASSLA